MSNFEKVVIAIFFLGVIISCDAQNKNKDHAVKSITTEKSEGTNPKIKTKVNKQYDSKGRIVKFDSTYSYYYSSKGFDSTKVVLDTVYKEFKMYYKDNLISNFNRQFNDIFLSDSLFKYDFLNEDYFRKRYELNEKKMNELFREMDSLKVSYLKMIHPEKSINKKKSK